MSGSSRPQPPPPPQPPPFHPPKCTTLKIYNKEKDITISSAAATATAAPSHSNTSSHEMENHPQQKEITIVQDEVQVIAASLQSMELTTPSKPKCCIYKVPDHIKKGKVECYRPLVISIGPAFYKDEKLEPMQELKLIYLKSFREHPANVTKSLEPCIKFVRDHEGKIRDSYDAQINLLESDEFVKMVVLDAVFLIYYFMLFSGSSDGPACNLKKPEIGSKLTLLAESLHRDLFLEENQLPYFVLTGIYNTTFKEVYPGCSFTNLALDYLGIIGVKVPGSEAINKIKSNEEITDKSSIQHLVDLRRMCCCLQIKNQSKPKGKQFIGLEVIKCITNVIRCRVFSCWQKELKEEQTQQSYIKFDTAKKLSVAGVKFESSQSHYLMDITFDKRKGVLKIPKLLLEDDTESALRSILFFEQCHYGIQRTFCDYILFFDTLIDSVEDIQVLQKNAIVENILGSDEEAVYLINKLGKHVTNNPTFAFSDVSKGLKDYASNRCNRWKAIFWSKYFNHPWAIISVIAAIILFILTLLQTITGFTCK